MLKKAVFASAILALGTSGAFACEFNKSAQTPMPSVAEAPAQTPAPVVAAAPEAAPAPTDVAQAEPVKAPETKTN